MRFKQLKIAKAISTFAPTCCIQHEQKLLGATRLTLPSNLFIFGNCPSGCISNPQERTAKMKFLESSKFTDGLMWERHTENSNTCGLGYFFQLFTAQRWPSPNPHLLHSKSLMRSGLFWFGFESESSHRVSTHWQTADLLRAPVLANLGRVCHACLSNKTGASGEMVKRQEGLL